MPQSQLAKGVLIHMRNLIDCGSQQVWGPDMWYQNTCAAFYFFLTVCRKPGCEQVWFALPVMSLCCSAACELAMLRIMGYALPGTEWIKIDAVEDTFYHSINVQ